MLARISDIEALYRRRYLAFLSTIRTVIGSREAAHDVVQDAFAEALRRRDAFRATGPLKDGYGGSPCAYST
jgi:DNA-directed RNA polymerase specialized sigma24 family protein